MTAELKVFFDGNCPLCRSLAAFMKARSPHNWQFHPQHSEEFAELPKLKITIDEHSYYEVDAWQKIIELHPSLSNLSWLARKVNLEQETANTFHNAGHQLRRFCRSCKR